MKQFIKLVKKYPQCWVYSYSLLYMIWFNWLETHVTLKTGFTSISSRLDAMIPFCEYFIIPYLLWFAYIAATNVFFLFRRPKKEFYRLIAMQEIGMTIALIIYTIFPNGQLLRPVVMERNNIFTWIVSMIYRTDTPTNVFPSLHVYVSLIVNAAWWTSDFTKDHKWIKPVSTVLTVLICLSTVFLKQHSVLDGLAAIIMAIMVYLFVYQINWNRDTIASLVGRIKSPAYRKSYGLKKH